MAPPTFTRGQWSRWASGTAGAKLSYRSALWVSTGAANDKDVQGNAIAVGSNFGDHIGGSGGTATSAFQIFGSGGAWNTTAETFVKCLAGGHGGWSEFEVNHAVWSAGAWNPTGRPQDPYTRLVGKQGVNYATGQYYAPGHTDSPEMFLDPNHFYDNMAKVDTVLGFRGFPNALHTADSMVWMPTVGRFFKWGGYASHWGGNHGGFIPFELDPTTTPWQWESLWSEVGFSFETNATAACWKSGQSWVIFYNGRFLWRYNPIAARGARIAQLHDTGVGASGSNYCHMFDDPTRNRAIILGTAEQHYYDFSSNPNAPTKIPITFTGDAISISPTPGGDYDPIADRYVIWSGGKTVYIVNPNTWAVTAVTPGVGVGIDPGTQVIGTGVNGGYGHRFKYVASADVFATINDPDEQGFAVFAPVRVIPTIAFTDIVAGQRTGNGDTSKGQTANQDGAIVTLFGTNFGSTTDTVAVTIGGAGALIYDRGAAAPPRCPANLSNSYQNLQLIVAQVNHSAAVGLGTITVTVNGVASNAMPFEVVSTGTIRYAGPGGGGAGTYASPYSTLATGVAALTPGDILYVRDGLNTPGGVSIPSASVGATKPLAIVAYPSAACTVGSSTHEGFAKTVSGSGGFMVYSKFYVFATDAAHGSGSGEVTLLSNSRMIGCNVQAPLGQNSQGAIGISGNNVEFSGNEVTNAGDPVNFDNLWHPVYVYGTRNVTSGSEVVETTRRLHYNYIHDNPGARGLNIYNGVAGSNPITGHSVQFNAIVAQVMDGILLGRGVVGINTIANNVLVNCGQRSSDTLDAGCGITLQTSDPISYAGPTTPATVVHIYGNTLLNSGAAGMAVSGAFRMVSDPPYTPDVHNNLIYQANGLPYFSPQLPATRTPTGIPAQWSNNLWFGAGAAPSGDTNAVNANPLLASATSPFNLRLLTGSPAIGTGTPTTGTDLDGTLRPAGAADIGAYQFGTTTIVQPPTIVSLQPASCAPGAATFTLTVFASAGAPFLTGAAVRWDGIARTTTFVTAQQITTTILAADVLVAGQHAVTVTNPGSAPSNALTFNVTLGQAAISLAFNGMVRDRVGQGTTALAADGAFDGVFTVTLNATGGRTITAMRLDSDAPGTWNTDGGPFFVLGVADSFDLPLRNDAVTMAVNFVVADGGTFVLFAADLGDAEFLIGRTLTARATFSDGSFALGSLIIQAPTTTTTVLRRLALAGGF